MREEFRNGTLYDYSNRLYSRIYDNNYRMKYGLKNNIGYYVVGEYYLKKPATEADLQQYRNKLKLSPYKMGAINLWQQLSKFRYPFALFTITGTYSYFTRDDSKFE